MFTKLGVVIPLGAGGDFDDVHTHAPAPLLLDGRVLLYYSGLDGSNYRIGLATSDDGIHFTKLGVVIPLGAFGDFDDTRIYYSFPLLLDGRVLLYYTGYDGATNRVGLAASNDGIHFTKLGVVLPLGADGEFDDTHISYPSPLLLDGRVLLYYTGHDGAADRIGLAASNDGIHFTKLGVVLPLGAVGDFDESATTNPSPLLLDGRILLYYRGYDGPKSYIGLAASNDGIHFTKLGVVLPPGPGGDFDDNRIYSPATLLRDGHVLLYYTGQDGGLHRIGLAVSDMGV